MPQPAGKKYGFSRWGSFESGPQRLKPPPLNSSDGTSSTRALPNSQRPLIAECCLLLLKRRPEKARQLPPIHIFVRRLAHGVMAARQHCDFVVEPVALEFLDNLSR